MTHHAVNKRVREGAVSRVEGLYEPTLLIPASLHMEYMTYTLCGTY